MKQVICIHWGTKYGPAFVNRLYGMVARRVTPPFTFTCFCDDPAGIRAEVRTEPLPEIDYDLPTGGPGIWPKSRLWGPRLADLSGPVLFLDLDLLIRDSLDPFFQHGDPEDIVLATNQSTPFERLGQTSVFRFPVGALVPLQDRFRQDPDGIAAEYRFEQRFVTRNAPGGVTLFPRAWVAHYRQDCRWPFPLNYALAPTEPRRAKIVIFPGGVHPTHAIEGRYGAIHRAQGPVAHIAQAFSADRPEPLGKHLRHYIRPAPWVARHWRD